MKFAAFSGFLVAVNVYLGTGNYHLCVAAGYSFGALLMALEELKDKKP